MTNYKPEMQYIDVAKLVPDASTPKRHPPAQIEHLRKSIRDYGFAVPLAINSEYKILKGNGSYQAAILEGYSVLPCVVWSHLTQQQQEALSIIDNKLALETDFDFDLLNDKLKQFDLDLSQFDIASFEFDLGILQSKNNTNTELNTDDYSDNSFEHECPKCKFRWND